jgi:enediyne biosynthesis protein E4
MRLPVMFLILVTLLLAVAGGFWVLRSRSVNKNLADEFVQPNLALSADLSRDSTTSHAEPDEPVWFTDVTKSTGIDFIHDSGTNSEKPFPSANGSGLAALDYDLDGLQDLYFATGTPFPIEDGRAAPINRCYRNLGAVCFQDVTEKCGLGHNGYSAGIAIGDYDADGFPDVYVNCFGSNVLYHNSGDGTFEVVSETAQAADPRWGTSVAFFDYDNDGLLDIYACNYAKWRWEDRRWCGNRKRNVRVYCSPHSVEAERDVLLRNLGDGTFADTSHLTGLDSRAGRGQGVVAVDLNRDGYCDLYVGNDLQANSLFINDGNGAFRDATEESGVAYDFQGSMQAGMGVASADVTDDGLPDLFVTNFANEHNSLYVNTASGVFLESSQQIGLYSNGYPWVGWGTAFADFDLDGGLDLVVTNGHVDENRQLLGEETPYAEPPLIWRMDQGRFRFLGERGGDYFSQDHVGRALIVVDLDNDRDQDLVIGHQDAAPALLRNECSRGEAKASSFSLRLVGSASNRDAVGASITMRWGEQSSLRQVSGGGSYLSSHDLRQVFASPHNQETPTFEIQWPNGRTSMIDDLQPGTNTVIIEPVTPAETVSVFVLKK